MKSSRVVYGTLSFLAFLFFIHYREYLSFLLFFTCLLLPVGLFVLLKISAKKVAVDFLISQSQLIQKESFQLCIDLQNRSHLSITHAQIDWDICNKFYTQHTSQTVKTPIYARNKQHISISISPRHIGSYTLVIREVRLYDFLRLSCKKIAVNKTYIIEAMPRTLNTNALLGEQYMRPLTDSDTFSKIRPGDDTSETFRLRPYQAGDRLSKVHWKLSAKEDTLIIKEPSFPVQNTVHILLELVCPTEDGKQDIDGLLETFCVLSMLFLDAGVEHVVHWYDLNKGSLLSEQILSDQGLHAALSRIMQTNIESSQLDTLLYYHYRFELLPASQILYLTPSINTGYIAAIEPAKAQAMTLFYCTDFSHTEITDTAIFFAQRQPR